MTISTLTDLVKVYTPTSGQGALTLGAAVPGFLTPSSVIPAMTSGSVVSYGISDPSGNEVGQGILTLTGSVWTLTRGVTQSSNGGAPILCTGQATVALTLRAEDVFQGQTELASGQITTPVAFIDLALPAGFVRFRLECIHLLFSAQDNTAFALSFDGGATWLNDTGNADSYRVAPQILLTATVGSFFAAFVDSLMNIGVTQDSPELTANTNFLEIIPGTNAELPIAFFKGTGAFGGSPPLELISNTSVNKAATVVPTPRRATNLRILPYGNGDANPPTSGHTITAGSYMLWGISL